MRASREINAEQIRLGRGAECELRLADPRVPIHARTILLGKSGAQLYEVGDQNADATAIYQAPLTLTVGTTLKIGPFQLVIIEPGDADLALTLELAQALPQNSKAVDKEVFFRATRLPVSRRLLAWALFLPILVWFLLLPSLNFFLDNHSTAASKITTGESRPEHQAKKILALAGDGSWNPGELSAGHQAFGSNCKSCHSESFTRVKDKDCKACHQNIGDHVSKKTGHIATLDGTRCASCHRDHKGALALQQQNTHYFMSECSSCHGNIKSSMANSASANTSDFAREHPEFRVMLAASSANTNTSAVPTRVRLPALGRLSENSALKFPHDVHLDPKGVNGPQGRIKTNCASCHTLDSTGTHFKPVTMKDHCQSCHELRFELAAPERQLAHGSVNDVMTSLREFYSYVAVNGIVLNRQQSSSQTQIDTSVRGLPGKPASAAIRLNGSADIDVQVQHAASEIFEKTSCFSCHVINRTHAENGDVSWIISPIKPAPARMPAATFSHDKHRMASCDSCHAASSSKSSHDVLMPKIESCRGCHAGRNAEPKKIVSNCGLCHGFHTNSHSTALSNAQSNAQSNTIANNLPVKDMPVLWPATHDMTLPQSQPLQQPQQPSQKQPHAVSDQTKAAPDMPGAPATPYKSRLIQSKTSSAAAKK